MTDRTTDPSTGFFSRLAGYFSQGATQAGATLDKTFDKTLNADNLQRKADQVADHIKQTFCPPRLNALTDLGKAAKAAAAELALADSALKKRALKACAKELRTARAEIVAANARDRAAGEDKGLSKAKLDRLILDEGRVDALVKAVTDIAGLEDPVGRVLHQTVRPNGLKIQRVSVPLGVIGIIYESRPNVTSDAAALCIKAGNACILRGGSDSWNSSIRIADCMRRGLESVGLNPDAVQRVPSPDRALVGDLLRLADYVDVIVPRGGKSLVARVQQEARVPVFSHLDGICHTYVDARADLKMALDLAVNAKMRRTGICGAMETLLVHAAVAEAFLPQIVEALQALGCELRGDERVAQIPGVIPATAEDWDTEYLDAIVSVAVVPDCAAAIAHINRHSSSHTDAIVTEDEAAAARFLAEVDSAIVMHNASTQFADGGEFGLGAEIGISTGRLHARGPVGAAELTTYKYQVLGSGQRRTP